MSLDHRITAFKRCFPFGGNSDELISFSLYLSVASNDVESQITLEKLGFEYGDCQKETVEGEIQWLEI